jgi:xanthine/uracil permease
MARIALVEIACGIVYAIPQTSVLGAILLTGYLGGATATHVRAGEPFFLPIVVGIVVWLGLFLREERLRALVPLRSPKATW